MDFDDESIHSQRSTQESSVATPYIIASDEQMDAQPDVGTGLADNNGMSWHMVIRYAVKLLPSTRELLRFLLLICLPVR